MADVDSKLCAVCERLHRANAAHGPEVLTLEDVLRCMSEVLSGGARNAGVASDCHAFVLVAAIDDAIVVDIGASESSQRTPEAVWPELSGYGWCNRGLPDESHAIRTWAANEGRIVFSRRECAEIIKRNPQAICPESYSAISFEEPTNAERRR